MKTWVKTVSQNEKNGQWHFAVSQNETGQKIHELVKNVMAKGK